MTHAKSKCSDYQEALAVTFFLTDVIRGARNQKYSQMGLFDITPTLFSPKNWLQMDLNELINVYFHEYSLANLMVFVSRNFAQHSNFTNHAAVLRKTTSR